MKILIIEDDRLLAESLQTLLELKDMIRNDEALSYDQVSQLRFEGSESYTVTYEKTSPSAWYGDDVYFTG